MTDIDRPNTATVMFAGSLETSGEFAIRFVEGLT
jgi:hypothetical protein